MIIDCAIPHDGYDKNKRSNPDKSDLRVSENFSMVGFSNNVKIICSDETIKFRIREAHVGSTDYDAYDGKYFSNGSIISKSSYDRLYISDPKKLNEEISTLPDCYSFKVSFENSNKIRFLVSSDFHFDGNKKSQKNHDDKTNLQGLCESLPNVGYIDFYAVCGDLTNDSNSEDEDMFEKEFFNQIRKISNISCVCEGWGNHDVRYKGGSNVDIKKGIIYRNTHYRQSLLYRFQTSDNEFHYHWQYNRESKRIHFFMLNNALGYNEIKNDPFYSPTDSAATNERNPYGALNFLKEHLDTFSKDDFYVIFCHINFCSMAISDSDNERWWNEGSMRDFATLIDESKGNYLCSFFGHLHTSAGKEYLKTGIGNGLLGYRCACKDKHGAAHYLLAEIDLASDQPKVEVTPYSNTGVKEDDIDKDRHVDITIKKWKY